MRDLSKSNYGSKKRISRKFSILIGGVFAVVLAVYGLSMMVGGGSSGGVILRDAPTDLEPVEAGEMKIEGGVDLKTEKASFKDVKYGGDAQASATRAYGGGVYSLTVEANLPDPKNTNYQVWLVGSGGPVSVDYMRGTKTSWSLNLRDSDKFSKYKGIWITLERTKDDLPEEHVLEGTF